MDAADPFLDAFLYTLPVYEMARARHAAVGGAEGSSRGRVNRLGHRRTLSDHQARSVTTPNNDTLYSSAWLDLEGGPLLLRVPGIAGRYWSIQFLDIYTNTIEMVGAGRSGLGAQSSELKLWIARTGDPTPVPAGHQVVRLPGRDAWMLVRIEVRSEAELKDLHALQDSMILSASETNRPLPGAAVPVRRDEGPRAGAEYLAVVNNMLLRNGVPEPEQSLVARWKPLGIGVPHAPEAEGVTLEWSRRLADLHALLARSAPAEDRSSGGWKLPDPAVGDFGADYRLRAQVAREGLGALPAREAVYFTARTDAGGLPLDAAASYRIRFPAGGLPADAFWSVSMYQVERDGRLFFSDNPLRRYSISSRTAGLVREADGSFEIVMQRTAPEGAQGQANWLPTPGPEHARFQLVLRAYLPRPQLLSDRNALPPIRRVD
jgi:hypothetical protein